MKKCMDKLCPGCQEAFTPKFSHQKYCSNCINDPDVRRNRARGRKQAQRERERNGIYGAKENAARKGEEGSRLCARCNAVWFVPSSNRQKYCLSCRLAAYRENRRAHRREYMRAYYLKKKLGSRASSQTTLF